MRDARDARDLRGVRDVHCIRGTQGVRGLRDVQGERNVRDVRGVATISWRAGALPPCSGYAIVSCAAARGGYCGEIFRRGLHWNLHLPVPSMNPSVNPRGHN